MRLACRTLVVTLALAAASRVYAATTDIRSLRAMLFRAITEDPNYVALTGDRVVPPSGSPSSGTALLSGSSPFTSLDFDITHDVPDETAAAIRGPGYANENAPVLFVLPLGPHKVGTWNFTPTEETYILEGRTYIEIQSTTFPAGAIRGQITASNPPIAGRGIWARVLVENLGPDTYVGNEPNAVRAPSDAAAGRLQISIDIEEPTKPGLDFPRLSFVNVTRDFAVTIAPFDTVELDMGFVNGFVASEGPLFTTTTATAQAPNVDPNPANDTVRDEFKIPPNIPVPALGWAGLLAAAVLLLAITGRALRRRARHA